MKSLSTIIVELAHSGYHQIKIKTRTEGDKRITTIEATNPSTQTVISLLIER